MSKDEQKNERPEPGKYGDEALSISYLALLRAAEPVDYLFMFLGVIGALVTGLSMPYFCIIFGNMLDALNSDSSFKNVIANLCYQFIGVSIANLLGGTAQVFHLPLIV